MMFVDHRERRSGVPELLARDGVAFQLRDLAGADYVLSSRVAVVRKTDLHLAPWLRLASLHRALIRVADDYPVVILVLQRDDSPVAPDVRRGALARIVRQGIAVLEAADAPDVASWIARLAEQESRTPDDGWRGAPGRKRAPSDRLAEQLVAWLPGVSTVGARRLLEHFGSVRAVATATAAEIEQVAGFGPKRAGAISALMAHKWAAPSGNGRPLMRETASPDLRRAPRGQP